jgi:uncharacterized membrane protein YfcA
VNSLAAKSALIGVAAGVAAGLFGIGGGLIIVPSLVLVMGLSQREASGTSIAAVVALSSTATIAFGISGDVDWSAAPFIFAGSAIGAIIGARLTTIVDESVLTVGFSIVLLVGAIRLLLS